MPQSGMTRHDFCNDYDEQTSQFESILQNVYSIPKMNTNLQKAPSLQPVLNENKNKDADVVK